MPRTGWTPEELRARALDAAELVIRRHGFARSKLTDVARELGISHAALYKHFSSKDELMDAVSARWLERIDAALTAAAHAPGSVCDRLQTWFRVLYEHKRAKIQLDPELFRAFDSTSLHDRPVARQHMTMMHGLLQELVAEGVERGELREVDPAATAVLLFEGTMMFHHPRLLTDHVREDRSGDLRSLLEVLLRGLCNKP